MTGAIDDDPFAPTRRGCYVASITLAIVNNLVPLLFIVFQTSYDLTVEQLGRLVLVNFGGQLVTAFVALRFVDRIGFRPPLIVGHVLCALGLLLLPLAPDATTNPLVGLAVAVLVYAVGAGTLEVVVSPVFEALPAPAHTKAAAMSLLHSFYCWGQVLVVAVTTVALTAVGLDTWRMLAVLWAFVPIANLLAFRRLPLPPTVPEHHRVPVRELVVRPFLMVAFLLMFCAGATELVMSQWSSLFAEDALGVSKVWGDLAGPCLFAVLMGLGRAAYGVWGTRIPLLAAMVACAALAVVCYVTVALAPNMVVSLAACALTGLAVSLLWPGTFSLSARRYPQGGSAMFGMLSVFGAAGGGIGPWVTGLAAGRSTSTDGVLAAIGDALPPDGGSGLRTGILVGVVFPLTVVVVTILLHRRTSGRARTGQPDAISPMDAVGRSY